MLNQPNPQTNSDSTNFVRHQWNSISPNHLTRPLNPSAQSPQKKSYSEAFNVSKRTGKLLWELLAPVLPDPKSKDLLQSIEIALYQWMLTKPMQSLQQIDDVPFLNGLQFNPDCTLQKNMKEMAKANRDRQNNIELTIPALNPVKDIVAPPSTESCTLKIMAVSYSIADGAKASGYLTEIHIPYKELEIAAENIKLPITAEKGILVIVAMGIEYTIAKEKQLQLVHNQEWMPSGIIWAGYN